jgi:hypothetical protein
MSKPIMKLFGVVFLAAWVLVGARAANAFEITQGIPDTDQTACVDVEGNHTASGTAVQSYPCNGGFNEQWSLVAANLQGLGTTASGTNCANLNTATTAIILSGCYSDPPPNLWNFLAPGQIELAGWEECFDSQSQYGSGAQIALNPCSSASSQLWTVRDLVIAQAIPDSDQYACADVQGQAIVNNTPVNAYPCTLGANERWTYVNGQLQGIGTSKSKSTCLGTRTGSGVVRAVLQTCSSSNPDQQWYIAAGYTSNGGSGNIIYSQNLNACLDSQGKYGNAQLVLTKCPEITVGSASELWVVR